MVLLERLSLGALDLFTSFNLIRYVLLVTLPLTVFWSMRKMGFSPVAAAIGGAASALISNDFRYGFEYDSYTWRGFGLYTQLWAMHLSFITLALVYRVIQTGRGVMWAIVAFSLLALSNLIYAYMMAITILVLFLFGLKQANLVPRTVRIGVVVLLTALIAGYMIVPFALESEYLNASPLLEPEKYASFGILRVGGWLLTGDLLDHARPPVLSVLLLIGIVAAALGRMRPALAALTLLVVWLVLFAGRPTLGPLANLLPFSDGLLFHRFIGGVHLAAILLVGVGGAVVWGLFAPHRRAWQSLAAALVVWAILLPAYAERADFHRVNDVLMRRSMAAISADGDATDILTTLESLPPGRIYAGLPTNWGQAMAIADIPFYNLLTFEGLESVTPSESLTLNGDLLWDFDERDASDYELFNVRYVVAPALLADAGLPSRPPGNADLHAVRGAERRLRAVRIDRRASGVLEPARPLLQQSRLAAGGHPPREPPVHPLRLPGTDARARPRDRRL